MTATLPDPRADYLGAMEWLINQTQRNAEDLKAIKDAISAKKTLGISDLSKRWGISASSLYADPVRQPNYGRADVGSKRWLIETVEAWEKRSEEERRDAWERMTSKLKASCIGQVRE